ncbi:MAG: hypothetical protein ABIG64_09600 [Candidatus Omnitrophota bacterium]
MNYFNQLFTEIINPFFLHVWGSLFFWRVFSFILFLVIVSGLLFKDNLLRRMMQTDRKKHDKEIFQLLDLIMPEVKLMEALNSLSKKYIYQKNSSEYIDKFTEAARKDSRQYLMPKLKKANLTLVQSLETLREFVNNNFIEFSQVDKETSLGPCLYPNPDIDGGGSPGQRDEKKYNEFITALSKDINSAQKNYQKFRSLIKDNLHI